ncbi:MAG: universal stress protein [Polyangiaceae bacterium]
MSQPLPRRILVGVSCAPDVAEPPLVKIADVDHRTIEQAVWLAARVKAEVHLFHVVDFIGESVAGHDDVEAVVQGSLTAEMEAIQHRAADEGVRVSYAFGRGRPWEALLAYATTISADLLMVSPRRDDLTTFQRLLHGSTTRRLLHHAPCAVWVVEPDRPLGVHRVLALVDDSPVSAEVVAATRALADAVGAEKHLLRCLDYPADVAVRRLPDAERALRHYHDRVRENAQHQLEKLVGDPSGWHLSLGEDWVARVVPRRVEKDKIDLVVLASVSTNTLRGRILGTTAEAILERSPVSAWVLRGIPEA